MTIEAWELTGTAPLCIGTKDGQQLSRTLCLTNPFVPLKGAREAEMKVAKRESRAGGPLGANLISAVRAPSLVPALVSLILLLTTFSTASASPESSCLGESLDQGAGSAFCEVTTIRSQTAGAINLHLPVDVNLANPWFGGNDIEIEGPGPFVGFALVRYPLQTNTEIYVGGRLPESADSRMFLEQVKFGQDLRPLSETFHLNAGEYRFFVLPGSGPASVTLHLDELEGEAALETSTSTGYEVAFPNAELASPSPAELHYSTRAHGSLRSQGFLFQAGWFHADAHAASEFDSCFFDRRTAMDPSDPATYGPGCATWSFGSPVQRDDGIRGAGGGPTAPKSTEPQLSLFYGGWDTTALFGLDSEPAGPYTAQLSLDSVRLQGEMDSMALFVSFD
jgi:hypothetical protein